MTLDSIKDEVRVIDKISSFVGFRRNFTWFDAGLSAHISTRRSQLLRLRTWNSERGDGNDDAAGTAASGCDDGGSAASAASGGSASAAAAEGYPRN
jgi:hypothetical protein